MTFQESLVSLMDRKIGQIGIWDILDISEIAIPQMVLVSKSGLDHQSDLWNLEKLGLKNQVQRRGRNGFFKLEVLCSTALHESAEMVEKPKIFQVVW